MSKPVDTENMIDDRPQAKVPFAVSVRTEGRVMLGMADLMRLFGSAVLPDVPMDAFAAEVVFTPKKAITVTWHCRASVALVEKLAPALVAAERAACASQQVDATPTPQAAGNLILQ